MSHDNRSRSFRKSASFARESRPRGRCAHPIARARAGWCLDAPARGQVVNIDNEIVGILTRKELRADFSQDLY